MEENSDEKSNEEIEETSEEPKEVENKSEEKSIEKLEQIDSDDSLKESVNEIEEEQDQDLEEVETLENLEGLVQETEELLIEGFMEKQTIEGKSDMVEHTTEGTILDEESLKLEVRTFHRNLIEAALYAAGGPLTIEELSTRLEFPKKEVETLVNELAFDYLDRTTALIIAQIGDRYQMQIKPEYTEKVSKFAKGGAIAERYLRTLTIIALKQPILKSMVIKLRGTGAYEHVKYLIDNDFINAIKKGRSQELTTTDKYADMFGLPKDIRLMKEVMIKQLGIEEGGLSGPPSETEEVYQGEPVEEDQAEPVNENMEGEE